MGSCCKPATRDVYVQTEPKIQMTVSTNYEIRKSTPVQTPILQAPSPLHSAPPVIYPYIQCSVTANNPAKLIEGYEKEPLLPLEDALQVFNGQIVCLPVRIQEAKAHCLYPSQHGLTRDQSAAIYIYSMRNDENCLYNHLQQAWKSNDRSQMRPWLKYLRLLLSGLNKLPDVKTEVWQGIVYNVDADRLLQLDSLPLYTYLGSCASSMKEVHEALESEQPGSRKILLEYSIDAKDVSDYTDHRGTKAMILPGLKVNKSKKTVYDQHGSFREHLTQVTAPTTPPIKTKTPIPLNTPTPIPKPIFKHFICPSKLCQYACHRDHEGNHCHGFFHLKHHCSHHCVRVNRCSIPRCKNHTLTPDKHHGMSFSLRQCNKCEGIFCEDCCFK